MKKVSKILLSILFCISAVFAVSACGKVQITSARVKSGTLETTIVKGEELDTSNTVVIFYYNNNTNKEVSAMDLTFSAIDTSVVGNKTLTITYSKEDYKFNVTIKVVASEADVNSIEQLESELLNDFNAKRTDTGEQTSFADKEQLLYVGDDNPFNFRILASGVDGAGNQVDNITKVRTNITVELKEGNGYVLLEGAELANYVTIDTENTSFQFSSNAIDKVFKITVSAVNADPVYEEYTRFSAELTVVDGYNVYDVSELSLYDNDYADDSDIDGRNWTDYKHAHGLEDIEVNGLILQKDIYITSEDVPSDVFWSTSSPNYSTVKGKVPASVEFEGTPIDHSGKALYSRVIKNGEKFNFIGNYFQINLSQFPKAVIEGTDATSENPVGQGYVLTGDSASYITTHLPVFRTEQASGSTITQETNVNWKNFNFYGNGALNTEPENSGSILLMKNQTVNFTGYNTIMNNFYIGYFFELGNKIETVGTNNYNNNIGQYVVDSCKGYNSYQCLFYLWGAEHTVIKNSEFKTAGGPAIIADHCRMSNNDYKTGNVSQIDIYKSLIESKVTANSVWFANYGMSKYVTDVAQAEMLYDGSTGLLPNTGKTIIPDYTGDNKDVAVLDMVALIKAGGFGAARCQGYVRIFETEQDYNKFYGYKDETQEYTVYGLDMSESTKQVNGSNLAQLALNLGSNFFESSGNGGYINSNVANNGLTSTAGQDKANGFNELVKALQQANRQEVVGIPNFDSMTFEQQKLAIKQVISAYESMIDQIYEAGTTNKLFVTDTNWESSGYNKVQALCDQVSSWTVKDYWTGEYVNLYNELGMGLVLRLYDKTTA